MGAYLSKPITEKVSEDLHSEKYTCGSSSMQGWRSSQEDAHNCILNLDKETSLFAVYDGHGGSEVAKYCSIYLPEHIKQNKSYLEGDLEQALTDSFLEFDGTIIKPEVITELEYFAASHQKEDDEKRGSSNEPSKLAQLFQHLGARYAADASLPEEEASALRKEATMPLDDLLASYNKGNPLKNATHLTEDKPMSPMLHAKKSKNLKSQINGIKEEESSKPKGINGNAVAVKSDSDNEARKYEPESSEVKPESSEVSSNSGEAAECEPSSSSAENACNEATSSSVDSATRDPVDSGNNEAEAKEPNEVSSSKSEEDKPEINISDEPSSSSSGGASSSHSEPSSSHKEEPSSNSMNSEPCSSHQDEGRSSSSRPYINIDSESSEDDEDGEYNSVDSSDEDSENAEESDEEDSDDEEDEDDEDDDDEADMQFLNPQSAAPQPGYDSGCTAVVGVIRGNKLYVANAGDSRCVVSRAGEAIEMSYDHKPDDDPEKLRIETAGGKVTSDGRVNGGLNLSRAIGDHSYKQNKTLSNKEQMITALPDIKILDLDLEKDEFIVLACDGIWNFMSSQDVIDYVRKRISKSKNNLSHICEELFDHCLAPTSEGDGTGCDNMTCIIVQLNKDSKRPLDNEDSAEATSADTKRIKLDQD